MPRFDDRYGNTRLYVGRLSSRTRSRDLERLFSRYGRVRDVDMKRDYAFVEFSDPRDADDARYYLDGRDFDGSRITVEASRGAPRGSRDSGSRGPPPPGSGRCFNCGVDGHWARDCTAGDWKNKCYRCGERGHIERNCKNSPSPKKARRGGSYSRSPVKSRSPTRRRRSRSRSYSRGRSYSRSRSPVRRERSVEDGSLSPKAMERSVSPVGKDQSLSPDGRDIDASPRENGNGKNSVSPIAGGEESPAGVDDAQDRSPIDDEPELNRSSLKAASRLDGSFTLNRVRAAAAASIFSLDACSFHRRGYRRLRPNAASCV